MSTGRSGYQVVRLRRADRAADLWPAIEAAQYGHIVEPEGGGAEDDAALGAFVDSLGEVIEAWEDAPALQAALIQKLDAGLAALAEAGCRVHWGTISRAAHGPDGEAAEIPIAILLVGRRRDEAIEIAVPETLEVEDEE